MLGLVIFLMLVNDTLPATPPPKPLNLFCVTGDMSYNAAKVAADLDPETQLLDLTGDKADRFMKAFNARPPESNATASRVIILEESSKHQAEIAMDLDGCVRGPWPLPWDYYRAIFDDAFGSGI